MLWWLTAEIASVGSLVIDSRDIVIGKRDPPLQALIKLKLCTVTLHGNVLAVES